MLLSRKTRWLPLATATNRPIVYILSNAALGAAIGLVVAAGLMLSNAGGVGQLIHNTSDPLAPILLILMGFATLFGGLYTAAAIMRLPRDG